MYIKEKEFIEITLKSSKGKNIYEQTLVLFKTLEPLLKNVIRTWIYIKDIDENYKDVVKARNKIFDDNDLTKETNFIASTCIGLPNSNFLKNEYIHLIALLVPNLNYDKLEFMSDVNIMPNTSEYGVRFERGVIFNSNKKYYIISGTASIDKLGNVKYINNIENQIIQALNNIDQLLLKYNQTIHNAEKIIGYVRNKIDIDIVKHICKSTMPNIEWNIIEGQICRPDWLVEFETYIIG